MYAPLTTPSLAVGRRQKSESGSTPGLDTAPDPHVAAATTAGVAFQSQHRAAGAALARGGAAHRRKGAKSNTARPPTAAHPGARTLLQQPTRRRFVVGARRSVCPCTRGRAAHLESYGTDAPLRCGMDAARDLSASVRQLLLGVGEQPDREGLRDTPKARALSCRVCPAHVFWRREGRA